MSENTVDSRGTDEDGNLTVIAIPADRAQQVIDFVASLESDEAEVSGHMISGGGIGSFGSLSAKTTWQRTDTACHQYASKFGAVDFDCTDSDKSSGPML